MTNKTAGPALHVLDETFLATAPLAVQAAAQARMARPGPGSDSTCAPRYHRYPALATPTGPAAATRLN